MGRIELYKGRPKENSGRLMKEIAVYDLLDKLQLDYFRSDHEPAETMEDCSKIGAALGCRICKNLFLTNKQHTEFYLLMMPGSKPFKTKELSPQLHSARLSFAEAEEMATFLNSLPGSASVMGLMNDVNNRVQLLIDEELTRGDYIGCHPCVNTSSLKIRTRDILEKVLPAMHHEPVFVKLTGM